MNDGLKEMVRMALIAICFCGLVASKAQAQGYGIYEARALAMGGTSVAIANTNHAQFYNPALLSFHDGREHKTRDGRVYFPMLSTQVSDAVGDLVDIDDQELEDDLTNAVNAYNLNQSTANANLVLASSQDLLDAITRVDDQNLSVDGFFGISIVEPSDREGGAFYLGVRAIGSGVPDITDTDLALLEDYVEGLEFVSTGGVDGVAHPELFNGDGTLADPTNNLTSTATGRGAGIIEFGVSLSKEFSLLGKPVALGVTPKLMMVRTYEVLQSVSDGTITTESDDEGYRTFNADIGIASEVTERIRVGVAVKDIVTKRFDTALGGTVRIEPKPRLGLGYIANRYQFGLDYDLTPTEPIGSESSLQEVSIGSEWQALDSVYLRAGYRHDLERDREDIVSLGLGLEFQKLLFDFTYAVGGDGEGAAIQMGYSF